MDGIDHAFQPVELCARQNLDRRLSPLDIGMADEENAHYPYRDGRHFRSAVFPDYAVCDQASVVTGMNRSSRGSGGVSEKGVVGDLRQRMKPVRHSATAFGGIFHD